MQVVRSSIREVWSFHIPQMFDDAFDRVRDAVDAGETPEIHFVEGFLRAANELSLNCCVRVSEWVFIKGALVAKLMSYGMLLTCGEH